MRKSGMRGTRGTRQRGLLKNGISRERKQRMSAQRFEAARSSLLAQMRAEPTSAGNALKQKDTSSMTTKTNKNGNGKSAAKAATKATVKNANANNGKTKKTAKPAAKKAAAPRHELFGQPVTQVIRALAKRGWKGARAIKAISAKVPSVSPATVRACIQNVRDKVGLVATLTAAQYKQLEKLAPKEA
jgi:hypothetical protein